MAENLNIVINAIDKTARGFRAASRGLQAVTKRVFTLQSALVSLGGVVALQRVAADIDNLAKTSRRLGLTVTELQSLQFAAEQTGVSNEELVKSMERFNRSISETSLGMGQAKRSFETLGISVLDNQGNLKDTDAVLTEVSNALKEVEDPAHRLRIAFDIFGRSGAKLVNTLADGGDTVHDLRSQFRNLTFEIDSQSAFLVEAANDRFNRVFTSLNSQIKMASVTLLDFFSKALSGLTMMALDLQAEISRAFGLDEMADEFDRVKEGLINSEIAAEALAKEFAELNKKMGEADNKVVIFDSTVRDAIDTNRELEKAMNNVGMAFENVILKTQTTKEAFRQMASSIITDLTRLYVKQQITGPLLQAVQGAVPSLFGSPQPARPAAIGAQAQAGRAYLVGERGPELMIPTGGGRIVPNDKLGGGSTVVVNQTINLSAGVSQTVKAEVLNMMPQIANAAKGAVLDAKRRGGSFSTAFGA